MFGISSDISSCDKLGKLLLTSDLSFRLTIKNVYTVKFNVVCYQNHKPIMNHQDVKERIFDKFYGIVTYRSEPRIAVLDLTRNAFKNMAVYIPVTLI